MNAKTIWTCRKCHEFEQSAGILNQKRLTRINQSLEKHSAHIDWIAFCTPVKIQVFA